MTIDIAKLRADTLALIEGTTPGPWQRDCWDILGSGVGVGTGSVCEVARQNGDDNKYWKYGEAEANVKLIAAAPTLAADNLRLIDDNLRLLDENERLRGVLERIETASRHWADYNAAPDAVHYAHESTARLASAALAEGGPDDR